jgi:ZPR1 zinc finger protein
MTNIPHFKEVIIMSLVCDSCGFKSNEIKGGGAIPKYGTRIILQVRESDDLAREVLKSDTAGIAIPELDLELEEGGLDGLYTTIEGLMNKMHDRLQQANPFGTGDAASKQHLSNDGGAFSKPSENYTRYKAFLEKLKDMADGNAFPFSMIISDPLSNSFIGPIPKDATALSLQAEIEGSSSCYESYVDTGMVIEEYERSHDQNEVLGLNDMKTENYQETPAENYGTDAMSELPDRITQLDIRGPDHPHEVGKAPVDGDRTIMGAQSANFAIPTAGLRGKLTVQPVHNFHDDLCSKLLHDFERNDQALMMTETFDGSKSGFVFKDGAQGLGYYTDLPLLELWGRYHADDETNGKED